MTDVTGIDRLTPPLVVVGVDGSPGDQHVLVWAAGEAAVRGRTLLVTHCTTRRDDWASWLADGAATWARHRGAVNVHSTVACAHPGAGLVGHVRAGDLLVVGSGRRPGVLGSTTEHVLRHARGEVAVIGPPQRLAPGPWAASVVGVIPEHASGAADIIATALAHGEAHRAPVVIAEVRDAPEHQAPLVADRPLSPALSRTIDSCHVAHPHVVVRRVALDGSLLAVVAHLARAAHVAVVDRELRAAAGVGNTVVVPALTRAAITAAMAAP